MFLQRIQGNLAEPIFVHNPRINVHFYFKSSIANNCRYFLWMVKKYPLQAKLRNLIVSLDKLYETHFHGCGCLCYKNFYYGKSRLLDNN